MGVPVEVIDRFDNGRLLRVKMPSLLVEAVFLSTPDEAIALPVTPLVRRTCHQM